ncbi:MAG: amidohydrolase, partial [Ginsengibacter sp.]
MRKYIQLLISFVLLVQIIKAQETIYPAKENIGKFYLAHATIHVGNGQIINDGTVRVSSKKIESVGANIPIETDAKVYDLKGKHIYPGLISPISNLGLKEVANGVRGTNDYNELG